MPSKYRIIRSKPYVVNDHVDAYQYQEPLTFEKVWQMFKETDKKFKETAKQFQEAKELMRDRWKQTEDLLEVRSKETRELLKELSKEADRRSKEANRRSKEADRRFKETERIVRGVSKNLGGIGNSIGEAAEEYFRAALKKMKEFAGVKIKSVGSLSKQLKDLGGEYDVVLFGKDTLIVVEVKHKLTRDDVTWFINKSLPTFKPLFPEYAEFRLIGAVAGMTAQKTAVRMAINNGLFVITQSGQKVSFLNPADFEPKAY